MWKQTCSKQMGWRPRWEHLASLLNKDTEKFGFPEMGLLGKMGKISTHTEVVWFLLAEKIYNLNSGLCSTLKTFYREEQCGVVQ